ncbi:MAG: SMP-30/gluconolactonase/LRE family protein, partial [Vicinamibacterales bacterium]
HWELPAGIGSMALREDGGAVLACVDGFFLFDFTTGTRTPIGNPEADDPETRFNDGKVDRWGRFIAGTADSKSAGEPRGALYRLDHDLTWHKLDDGYGVSNGPCWSPDGDRFYVSDSRLGTIFAYDYDLDSGAISNRRIFATTEKHDGLPDGATVDADGFRWSAIPIGGRIVRFAPDGSVARALDAPVTWVTSVMFGGPHLDILYLTSLDPSTKGITDAGPDEGGLFAVHGLSVTGLPEPRFAS